MSEAVSFDPGTAPDPVAAQPVAGKKSSPMSVTTLLLIFTFLVRWAPSTCTSIHRPAMTPAAVRL